MSDTLTRVTEIFREVFEDEGLVVTRRTTAEDVEAWDSLMHVTLVINVEKAFSLRFRSAEVAALKDVGELVDLVESYQRRK